MYCIGKIRYLLDDVSCKAAVSSLVLSRLDYANSLLVGSNGKLIKRLQLIQNNAAGLITKTKMSDHITPILSSLHWLPILVRIEFKLLLIIYKCLNNQCPNYLQSLVSVYVPARSLRSSQDSCCLTKGIPQRSYGKRAFAFAAPPLWNALPLSIRISPSVQSFKSSLKTHLFRRTYILNWFILQLVQRLMFYLYFNYIMLLCKAQRLICLVLRYIRKLLLLLLLLLGNISNPWVTFECFTNDAIMTVWHEHVVETSESHCHRNKRIVIWSTMPRHPKVP